MSGDERDANLAAILNGFAERQKRLDPEFEAAIFSDLDGLYEPSETKCNLFRVRGEAAQERASALAEIERLKGELAIEQREARELLLIAHLDGAKRGQKQARNEALEDAAKVADGYGWNNERAVSERLEAAFDRADEIAAVIRAMKEAE